MNSLDILTEMIDHMNWADGKVWTTVLDIPKTQEDEKIKNILHHYQLTKNGFYCLWLNLPLEIPEISNFKSLYEMAEWASVYPGRVQTYLAGIEEDDLNRIIEIPWAKRLEKVLCKKPAKTNLGETIIQVAVHSSHHRGQVNVRIRELSGEPPLVDFIAWTLLGKPKAVWPV